MAGGCRRSSCRRDRSGARLRGHLHRSHRFNYDALVQSGTLVVDTRNALKHHHRDTIFRL